MDCVRFFSLFLFEFFGLKSSTFSSFAKATKKTTKKEVKLAKFHVCEFYIIYISSLWQQKSMKLNAIITTQHICVLFIPQNSYINRFILLYLVCAFMFIYFFLPIFFLGKHVNVHACASLTNTNFSQCFQDENEEDTGTHTHPLYRLSSQKWCSNREAYQKEKKINTSLAM